MTIMETPAAAAATRRARWRRDLGELDYQRGVVQLRALGETQTTIARLLDIAQPTVQKLLKRADHITMPLEGFSGADPYEICERYAADYLTREQLVDELTRWEYAPRARTTNPLDDLIVNEPGSVADLERALHRGLIDDDLFDEIADQLEERTRTA